jgi:hypothetical protein
MLTASLTSLSSWNCWPPRKVFDSETNENHLALLLFHCMHQTFINHRRLAALQIIMHVFVSFLMKDSLICHHPSLYHWMYSWHVLHTSTKLMMNVSRFHVFWIKEMDYRPHFTCGRLLDFFEHCKTHRKMRKRSSIVCKWRPCLPKGPTNSACTRIIVTAALQQ